MVLGDSGTSTVVACQMSRAYSRIVRSLENLPTHAMLRIHMLVHSSFFCKHTSEQKCKCIIPTDKCKANIPLETM